MSVTDELTGLIPVAIGAGLVTKVVDEMMPQQQGQRAPLPTLADLKQTIPPGGLLNPSLREGFGKNAKFGNLPGQTSMAMGMPEPTEMEQPLMIEQMPEPIPEPRAKRKASKCRLSNRKVAVSGIR